MADAGGARTGSHGPDASPAPGAPQALLVDPSEIALRFLQTRLARLGVASRTARDSTEALSLLQRFDPDLVFIDAELAPASPLDGLALARRVRAEYETRVPPLPVFALASRIGEVDRVRATAPVGFPCRVSLADAEPGDTLVLVHHLHHAIHSIQRIAL